MHLPGTEVDKAIGSYVSHDSYTTSQELNRYLQDGGSVFYVGRRDFLLAAPFVTFGTVAFLATRARRAHRTGGDAAEPRATAAQLPE